MPIKIPSSLPATKILQKENIFVMTNKRAKTQDIRPLKIAIVNLMPTKIATETQILRLLANSPLQVEISLFAIAGHSCHNTDALHLQKFYVSSEKLFSKKFDGLIITGAPVEQLDFCQVDYWKELCKIMDWAKDNVYSTLYICWAALAGLYYNFGVQKVLYEKKISGIFFHTQCTVCDPLLRGFDDVFPIPMSRYSGAKKEDIAKSKKLVLLAQGEQTGVAIAKSKDNRQVFITGHFEYDTDTLQKEYQRDVEKGINPAIPQNYFPNDDPLQKPVSTWKACAHLFYSNWLNYYVYQDTPFDLEDVKKR